MMISIIKGSTKADFSHYSLVCAANARFISHQALPYRDARACDNRGLPKGCDMRLVSCEDGGQTHLGAALGEAVVLPGLAGAELNGMLALIEACPAGWRAYAAEIEQCPAYCCVPLRKVHLCVLFFC